MQNCCHFWLNVQGITFAGLAPKLIQIALTPPKQTEEAPWNGLSEVSAQISLQVNRFGARGQNVLGSNTYFSHLAFFYNNFRTIYPTTTNLISSCFSRWDESSDAQFCPKKAISKFDLSPNLGSQARSGQSWSYWVSFDSGSQDKHWNAIFIRLSPLIPKLWTEEQFPLGYRAGSKIDPTWSH